mmetsp:Transcript_12737/g.31092  ORF Transcript_12737/g.31092 Transcript_12737/m.31092 type:complete len:312 (+) Transcript_12737:73-1008(+)
MVITSNIDESNNINDTNAAGKSWTSTTEGGQNCSTGADPRERVDPSQKHKGSRALPNKENAKVASECSFTWPVLLYIPNLLGFLRILLSFYGLKHALRHHQSQALNIWIVAALLDLIDGVTARMLNQCSQVGVLLDIMADNILRTAVWVSSMIASSNFEPADNENCIIWVAIICLEWITMFCSQNKTNQEGDPGAHWKDVEKKSLLAESNITQPPFWVQAVFKNNFRSPLGVFAIYGLFVAPFGTYVFYADHLAKETWPSRLLSEHAISLLVYISYAGRFLSALVEIWICYDYLGSIVAKEKRQSLKQKCS